MTTLDLVLKHKWYDMIAMGKKREEYRDITPHWTQRIARRCSSCQEKGAVKRCLVDCDGLKYDKRLFINFNRVRFHRGYTSTTITFAVREVVIDTGRPEWGAEPGKQYYVIRLGECMGMGA